MLPWVKITSAFGFCAAVFELCADAPDAAANSVTKAIRFIITVSFSDFSFSHSRQREHCKQNSPQSQLSSIAVEPFLQRVGAAAGSAAADCTGPATER